MAQDKPTIVTEDDRQETVRRFVFWGSVTLLVAAIALAVKWWLWGLV